MLKESCCFPSQQERMFLPFPAFILLRVKQLSPGRHAGSFGEMEGNSPASIPTPPTQHGVGDARLHGLQATLVWPSQELAFSEALFSPWVAVSFLVFQPVIRPLPLSSLPSCCRCFLSSPPAWNGVTPPTGTWSLEGGVTLPHPSKDRRGIWESFF